MPTDDVLKTQRATARLIKQAQEERSGLGAPVRRSFVEREEGSAQATPLAEVLSHRSGNRRGGGGRGGGTRLTLELSLLWVLAKHPHETNRPLRFWAELLGLPDPQGVGADRVRNAMRGLEERGLLVISSAEIPGYPSIVRLRNEVTKGPYGIPPGKGDPYLRVPEAFWTRGLVSELSGPGVAMYLVVLAMHGPDTESVWFRAESFRSRFGLAESTRKAGLKDLVENFVLDAESQPIGSAGGRTWRRNVYTLAPQYRRPA